MLLLLSRVAEQGCKRLCFLLLLLRCCRVAEMLYCTSLLAYVGAGEQLRPAPGCLSMRAYTF